jgi:AraC-like DNA-binding protein
MNSAERVIITHSMTAENLPKIYLYRRIVQAKLFIDRNYQENIDAGEIADEAHYSKFHFIRTFKSIYGKTPHQYLTAVRIEKAKEMLESGRSVTEACFSVGFDSLGSFTVLFKRRSGLTPSEYRRGKLERKGRMLDKPLSFIPGCFVEQMNRASK